MFNLDEKVFFFGCFSLFHRQSWKNFYGETSAKVRFSGNWEVAVTVSLSDL
jgi:hypothetical protein